MEWSTILLVGGATASRTNFGVGKLYFKLDSYLHMQSFLRSVIFPYNSLYTQAVTYTTYFELGKPEDGTV